MTQGRKLILIGAPTVVLGWLMVYLWFSDLQQQQVEKQTQKQPEPFQPVKPKITKIDIKDDDPHFCKKPDDAYFANRGHSVPMPAGSGEFHDPQFLFDTKHLDNKVTWAQDFTGTVIVCFVVNIEGIPEKIAFPSSPGGTIEQNIIEHMSGWHYKPGWYNINYRDREPHVVPTQMAFDFVFQ